MRSKQVQPKSRKAALVAAVSSIAMMAAYPAIAQNEERPGDATDEIIVEGKFQQSVIDRLPIDPEELPFSLSVMDREFLDELNFARPIDALATLPNITIFSDVQGTGTPLMLSRGFFVPLLVDNRAENAFRGASAQDDSFVERYEVMKGPASVSVGPVEGGGGIFNTVTKTPQIDQFVGVELRTDQFGTIATEFDYNSGGFAGNDAVLFRLSGAYRDWQFDADPTKRETLAIRPVVTFDISSSTAVKLSASYIEHNVNPNKGFPAYNDGSIPDTWDTDTFFGLRNGDGTAESHYYAAELTHNFLDNLKLTVRGSHQTSDFSYENTSGIYSYFPGPAGIEPDAPVLYTYGYGGEIEEENNYLDAQLATNFDFNGNRQDIVVGATYNDNSFYRLFLVAPSYAYFYLGPYTIEEVGEPRYGGPSGSYTVPLYPFGPRNDDSNELQSFYAEAAIRPFDNLTIVAGIRHDDVDTTVFNFRDGTKSTYNNKEVSTRVGATYTATDDLNFYLSYSDSFTPQTGNQRDGGEVGGQRFEGWEIGAKGGLFDRMITFTAAYFDTLRTNVAAPDPNNAFGEDFVVTVAEQETNGFEVTGAFRPNDAFTLNLSYGNIDIDIDNGATVGAITQYSIPNNTFSSYATYEFQGGPLQNFELGAGVRWTDTKRANVPGVEFPSITLIDASASYPITEKIDLSVDVHNLADELYRESSGTFFGRLTGSHVFGAPRTVSLTLRATF